ncbi:MAG: alanine racemase [Oscillospiraceae bacterium]|nr:alanine racemase [Oscillospiraceae bacterium]
MESTLKRTWTEVNLDHLTHNFETIRKQVGQGAKLLGVVKADAYGHGAVRVAKHLEKIGAGYLAVSNIDECEELRVNGVTLPILMLGFTPADQVERILKNDMTQALPNLAIAEAYSAAAVRACKTMKVHIKLDTGMGRLGFQCDEAHFDESLRDILQILALPGLDVEGVFTHFCVSDEAAEDCVVFTNIQHDRFLRMIDAVETQGHFKFRLHHCCNAGGIASYPEWAWDMVRCGIILYGTGDLAEKMGMKPVMTVKTTVSTIKGFDPDTSISYGRRFFTTRPSRIAVLPIGYADGLFRALSGKLRVLTPYGEAQQVGRICMDMCMIDVTDLPQLKVGDEIEVFGEHELIETAAKQCGTISYELLCAVSKRVPRYYYLGGKCVDHNLQLLG